MMGAATENARLPRFSLVLGIESCCEVDDLSCLGMYHDSRCYGRSNPPLGCIQTNKTLLSCSTYNTTTS